MNLKERMLLRKIEKADGNFYPELKEFIVCGDITNLDRLSDEKFDWTCAIMDEFFADLPAFNCKAYEYFAKKNKMSLAAKCFNRAYSTSSDISPIKKALDLGIPHQELSEVGVYNRLDICKLYELYTVIKDKKLEELILNRPQEKIFKLYLEKVKFKGKFKNSLDIEILEKLYDIEISKKLVLNLGVDDLCWCIDKIELSKNVKKAYEFYNELISINKPGKVDTHILNNRLINTIFENDTGKYTYMLLLCHKNRLSIEDVKRFEEKLDNCDDKQYKYFYLFHTKKDEVLKQFKNYTEFVIFLASDLFGDGEVFSDKDECFLMSDELEKEINEEIKNNNTKYKDALDAISVSNQMHLMK